MPRKQQALVIFARHPSSRVKTRLVPPLSRRQARELHSACLESTLRLAVSLPGSIEKWLYLTPPRKKTSRKSARLRWPPGLRRRLQGKGNLGARLRRAVEELRSQGYGRIVFLGSDSPTLPPPRLHQAFAALRRADGVLGPARDGGFYLLGMRVEGGMPANVFRGIAWGTARACRQVRARLRAARRRTVVLRPWYDVDRPADLVRLRRELRRSRRAQLAPLRAWLERN